jgi:hypothetical protein
VDRYVAGELTLATGELRTMAGAVNRWRWIALLRSSLVVLGCVTIIVSVY